jgi:hypothetical protein
MQISCHNNNNFNWDENQTSKHLLFNEYFRIDNVEIKYSYPFSQFEIQYHYEKIQNIEEKWGCRGE